MTKAKPTAASHVLILGDARLIDPCPLGDAEPDVSRAPSLGSYQ